MNKHILYLASGNSRRFGENKLLYAVDGKPMYLHGLEVLCEVVKRHPNCTLTVVSQHEKVREGASAQGIRAIDSPESVDGMSYTIKNAIRSLGNVSTDDFLLFAVADQPNLTVYSVEKLLERAKEGTETACLSFHGNPGNPTLFSAKYIPELLELQGDRGGKAVLKRHDCIFVEAEDETELIDIDTKN